MTSLQLLGHGWVVAQRGLEVGGVDVEAARNDHVLLAVEQREEAVGVEAADVAGADEALAGRVAPLGFRRFLRLPVIPGHHHAGVADLLMFETAGGILPGGNAKAFDWTFLSGRSVPLPWMLAGGLTPDNVAEAVQVSGAATVDVSSGVESSRGVKSTDLIRAFLERVKGIR